MLQMKFDKMYTTKDIYTIYNWMLDDCGCDLLPEVPYEKRKLPYEDVFPMLYLKYRLSGGNSTHKNIKHLVIDGNAGLHLSAIHHSGILVSVE